MAIHVFFLLILASIYYSSLSMKPIKMDYSLFILCGYLNQAVAMTADVNSFHELKERFGVIFFPNQHTVVDQSNTIYALCPSVQCKFITKQSWISTQEVYLAQSSAFRSSVSHTCRH